MISKVKFFFSFESLKIYDNITSSNLKINFIFFTVYLSKCKNQEKYFNMILLVSDDISLNPGYPHNTSIDGISWNVFNKKGMHFLHINVKSLLPKIEEMRFIAKSLKQPWLVSLNKTRWNNFWGRNLQHRSMWQRQKRWKCRLLCKT